MEVEASGSKWKHRTIMKHVSARGAIEDQNKKVTLTQQLLPVLSKDVMTELVKTFLAPDIPLHKLRNPHVIQLFENLGEKMSSETVCRDYVKTLANNEQDRLKCCYWKTSVYALSSMRVKWIRRNLSMLLWETSMWYLIEYCVTETVNHSIICMKIDNILHKLTLQERTFFCCFRMRPVIWRLAQRR